MLDRTKRNDWRVDDNESTIPYRASNLRNELDNAADTSLWNDDTRIASQRIIATVSV